MNQTPLEQLLGSPKTLYLQKAKNQLIQNAI